MRQANSTIKGYLYQFNKSILEIICADDNSLVTLEGTIEDIDIKMPDSMTTIQCKYHEDSKFTLTSVAEPILEMVCNHIENLVLGKNVKYILYAYYRENVDVFDKNEFKKFIEKTTSKELQLKYYHRIFKISDSNILTIANKLRKSEPEKIKILEYYKNNSSTLKFCIDWDKFWDSFIYINAKQFDELKEEVIQKLCLYTDPDTSKELYYPNALSIVANMSAKEDVNERTISKEKFINLLKNKKHILVTQWALAITEKKKVLKLKKQHFKSLLETNTEIRAFIFTEQFIEKNKMSIIPFIIDYIYKYFRKKKLHKPPLFIFENNDEIMQKVIVGLFKYQKLVNSGLVGNQFVEDSFINNTNCSPGFVCKITKLSNITTEILESCNVNQLYIIGASSINFESDKYYSEKVEIDEVRELRYLVYLDKNLEV